MENEEKNNEVETQQEQGWEDARSVDKGTKEKYFQVRDIVFLAICAAAALLFSAVMPLVAHTPIYGIIQIVVSLQTSFFFALGLYKVRKSPALLFMALCSAIIQVFMAPVMFFMSLISGAILELVALIIPGHWKNNVVRWLGSILFIPLQMPALYIYYAFISQSLPDSYLGNQWWFILLMVLAVIALNVLGTVLGNLVGRELDKAGVLDGSKSKKRK
ncbi:MAG: hypothetical protein Q4F15_01350 [Bacillota bacterium]|nr:hypothetical protein [Bacillota bacterium]